MTQNQWRSIGLWTATGVGLLACVTIGAALLAPAVLSSRWGNEQLQAHLSNRIPGLISWEGMQLSWFRGCSVKHLTLQDASGVEIAYAEEISVADGLLHLLQRRLPHAARLTGGWMKLQVDPSGMSNMEQALGWHIERMLPHAAGTRTDLPAHVDHIELDWIMSHHQGELVSSGLCRQGAQEGSWRCNSSFSARGEPLTWDVDAQRIPTSFLEVVGALLGQSVHGIATAAVGDHLSVLSSYADGAGSCTLHSPISHLEWDLTGPPHQMVMQLQRPGTSSLSEEVLNHLLPRLHAQPAPAFRSDLRLHFQEFSWSHAAGLHVVAELAVPFEFGYLHAPALRMEEGRCTLQMGDRTTRISIDTHGETEKEPWTCRGSFLLNPLKGSLYAQGLPGWLSAVVLPLTSTAQTAVSGLMLSIEGLIEDAAPKTWELRLDGVRRGDPSATPVLTAHMQGDLSPIRTTWKLDSSSPIAEVRGAGTLHFGSQLQVHQLDALLRVNQHSLRLLGWEQGGELLGKRTLPLQIALDPVRIPIYGALPSLTVHLESTPFSLGRLPDVQVDQLKGMLQYTAKERALKGTLHAGLRTPEQAPGSLELSYQVLHLTTQPTLEAELHLRDFPTELLGRGSAHTPAWLPVVGRSMKLDAEGVYALREQSGRADVTMASKTLEGNFAVRWSDHSVYFDERPAALRWSISPATWELLREEYPHLPDIQLQDTWKGQLSLAELQWPAGQMVPSMRAEFEMDALPIHHGSWKAPLVIQRMDGQIYPETKTPGGMECHLSMAVQREQERSTLRAQAFWLRARPLDSATGQLLLQGLPTELLQCCGLSQGNSELAHLVLGNSMTARLALKEGPRQAREWDCLLQAPYLQMAASGWVDPSGVCGLNDPLEALWTIAPGFQEISATEYGALLQTIEPAQTIALQIPFRGTRWSARHRDLSAMTLPQVIVDPGKISVSRSATLQGMFDFLKMQDVPRTLELWSTPLFMSLQDEELTLARVDCLLNQRTRLALWGSANLESRRLQMTIGLPSELLSTIFALGRPAAGSMLTVDVRGTLEDPQIDWAAAAARLAIAPAARQFGGIGGAVLGSVLDRATTTQVPPPTTSPFPWQDGSAATPKTQISKNLRRRLAPLSTHKDS